MPRLTSRIVMGTAGIAALAVTAAPALAGEAPPAPCSSHVLEHPFTRWLDPAAYVLAPGGNFEAGGPQWRLTGGASAVAGNEPYRVGGARDARALRLPAGGSATSPPMCVNLAYPTVRFFAKADVGSQAVPSSSRLKVDVIYTDAFGIRRADPVLAAALAGTAWSPGLPAPILGGVDGSLHPKGQGAIQLRFTALGSG